MRKADVSGFVARHKKILGYLLIGATALLFGWYISTHPGALEPLRNASPAIIPLLLGLYFIFLTTNFIVATLTIIVCGKAYPLLGSLQLTIYSTLVNFFGPLQSGPGFRAIYLKRKLNLSIKSYTAATSFYYLSFAVISLTMLLGAKNPLLLLGSLAILSFVFFRVRKNFVQKSSSLRWLPVIFLATLVQLSIIALIYYIELRSVGYSPSLTATLAYTGSANLALFVAFTPGAVGIRESFIYFAQSIHGIPPSTVINASVLDRSVYLAFLFILFLFVSGLHIKERLTSN